MKFLLSRRAWIIYSHFLLPPFLITLLWLLLPVNTYASYAFSITVYYCMAFFAWMFFYDLAIPGMNKVFFLISFLVFTVPVIVWLKYLASSPLRQEKLSYSVINVFRLIITATCYLVYVWMLSYRKKSQATEYMKYEDKESASGTETDTQQDEGDASPYSLGSYLAEKLCFKPSIDSETRDSYMSPLEKKQKYGSIQYNQKMVEEEDPASLKTMVIIVLFQATILSTWVWLQYFTGNTYLPTALRVMVVFLFLLLLVCSPC